jgi:alanine-glyoxylate transaminase/serine-glyoxylate transaminase/serine-pyruvate transaminase
MSEQQLPSVERVLLGPGPSLIAPRVMRAMAAPVLSHLDPDLVTLLDDVRGRLTRVFKAPEGTLTIAMSGTGTSGMEAMVANLVGDGTRVLVVVGGYFGERLAEMCRRYGATVSRLDVEWGRAADPAAVAAALKNGGQVDIVACVHAETSTGVLNPVKEIAALTHERPCDHARFGPAAIQRGALFSRSRCPNTSAPSRRSPTTRKLTPMPGRASKT